MKENKNKKVEELDNERQILNNEFEAETDKQRKGELLKEWIRKTEERYELKSTKKERFALASVKKFYDLGLKMGKWKEKEKQKIKK